MATSISFQTLAIDSERVVREYETMMDALIARFDREGGEVQPGEESLATQPENDRDIAITDAMVLRYMHMLGNSSEGRDNLIEQIAEFECDPDTEESQRFQEETELMFRACREQQNAQLQRVIAQLQQGVPLTAGRLVWEGHRESDMPFEDIQNDIMNSTSNFVHHIVIYHSSNGVQAYVTNAVEILPPHTAITDAQHEQLNGQQADRGRS